MIFVHQHKQSVLKRLALATVALSFTTVCAAQPLKERASKVYPIAPIVSPVQGAQVEDLNRGLVVIRKDNVNYVSWRMLATDPKTVSFDVYRNGQKINSAKLTNVTFFTDEKGEETDQYHVKAFLSRQNGGSKPVARGSEKSDEVQPWNAPYLSIPLIKPDDDWFRGEGFSYSANDASVADLDGDGQYEILLKWYPNNAKDNSQAGFTGPTFIDAYTLEGEQLWRINLGTNIRSGAHYTQFIAYDFDGDGRAEVAMKTADGTIDGEGHVIGDASADYRNDSGYVLDGPEYLTMFDGLSGKALDTIDYEPPRGNVSDWGDSNGNRVDRFLGGVAYLSGDKPSLYMARGYYTRVVIAAYDWVEGKFQSRWVFDTDNGGADALAFGQGAHSTTVGDVDGDGKDEIVYGAATIDDDGHLLYSTGLGHGDAQHLTDIDPNRPGMEIYMVHETPADYTKNGVEYGVELHDAETGEILWFRPSNQADVGRGLSADIDPRYVGNENWAIRGGLVAADGTIISGNRPAPVNFATWWDGDLSRELLDKTTISKWLPDVMGTTALLEGADYDVVSNNGSKATPTLSADIFGDWREEVIWATEDSSELRIFSTTHSTEYRFPTLMHETQYRTAIAWQNVGYNQPPHPAFYLGTDMQETPDYGVSPASLAPFYSASANGFDNHVVVNIYRHDNRVRSSRVYRSTSDNPENKQLIGSLRKTESRYVDTDVEPDVTYVYWVELDLVRPYTTVSLSPTYASLSSSLIPVVKVFPVSSEAPVKLSWFTRSLDISSVEISRATISPSSTGSASLQRQTVATLSAADTEWSDASSVGGEQYNYWLTFITSTGERVEKGPIFAERFAEAKTNLISEELENGIQITWSLEDFPQAIIGVQIYRNTVEKLAGRTRINASAAISGTMIDSQDLQPGTKYYYMFKLTMEDGSTVNTDPEAVIIYKEGFSDPQTNLVSQQVDGGIQLDWSLTGFAQGISNVEIYRNTSPVLSGRVRINPGAPQSGSFVDTQDLVAGTEYYYMFKLRMEDGSTINTDPEAGITYTVANPDPQTNLVSQLVDGGIQLDWSLTGFAQGISNVEIYRNTSPVLSGRVRINPGAPQSGSFVDTQDLVAGTEYYYMFKLRMEDGSTINTDPEAGITYTVANPEPQTNLVSQQVDGGIQLDWSLTGFAQGISNVEIYRNTSPVLSGRVRINPGAPQSGSFVDTQDLVAGTEYYYMFKLRMEDGSTINTDPEAGITYTVANPEPQTNLVSQQVDGGIQLDWSLTGFAQGISNVEIYRNTSPVLSGRVRINPGAPQSGSFVDTQDLVAGTEYYYMFKLRMEDGSTINTDPEAGITYTVANPDPQTNLVSQQVDGGIQLDWSLTGFAQGISNVEIYRNTSPVLSGRVRINPGAPQSGSFVDTQDLVAGTEYYYMFKLRMEDGSTINTDPEAGITYTVANPDPQTNLVSQQVDGGIQLDWSLTGFAQGISNVEIYRNTSPVLSGRVRINPGAPQSGSFVDTQDLVAGTEYYYMFKLRMEDGSTINTDPEAGIVY